MVGPVGPAPGPRGLWAQAVRLDRLARFGPGQRPMPTPSVTPGEGRGWHTPQPGRSRAGAGSRLRHYRAGQPGLAGPRLGGRLGLFRPGRWAWLAGACW